MLPPFDPGSSGSSPLPPRKRPATRTACTAAAGSTGSTTRTGRARSAAPSGRTSANLASNSFTSSKPPATAALDDIWEQLSQTINELSLLEALPNHAPSATWAAGHVHSIERADQDAADGTVAVGTFAGSTSSRATTSRGTIVSMTRVVSLRLDEDDSAALAAVGRGSGGAYLRRLLLHDLKERRRGCDHSRHWRGRCADCGAALRHRVECTVCVKASSTATRLGLLRGFGGAAGTQGGYLRG